MDVSALAVTEPKQACDTGQACPSLRLDQLRAGQRATVCELTCACGHAARLCAMGVREGQEIELLQAGSPVIVGLLGARLGVSRDLACHIRVRSGN